MLCTGRVQAWANEPSARLPPPAWQPRDAPYCCYCGHLLQEFARRKATGDDENPKESKKPKHDDDKKDDDGKGDGIAS